jgi:hypothetical protein
LLSQSKRNWFMIIYLNKFTIVNDKYFSNNHFYLKNILIFKMIIHNIYYYSFLHNLNNYFFFINIPIIRYKVLLFFLIFVEFRTIMCFLEYHYFRNYLSNILSLQKETPNISIK